MSVFDVTNNFLRIDREVLVILGRKPNPKDADLIFDYLRSDFPGGYLGWSRWVRTEDGKIDVIPLDHDTVFRK